MQRNAADEQLVRKRQQSAKDADEQRQRELKGLLQIPEFRAWVWRLLGEKCKIMESPGSTNGSIQSANVGRGDVGREVWLEIEGADPLAIPLMMRETYEAAQAAERFAAAAEKRSKRNGEESQQ